MMLDGICGPYDMETIHQYCPCMYADLVHKRENVPHSTDWCTTGVQVSFTLFSQTMIPTCQPFTSIPALEHDETISLSCCVWKCTMLTLMVMDGVLRSTQLRNSIHPSCTCMYADPVHRRDNVPHSADWGTTGVQVSYTDYDSPPTRALFPPPYQPTLPPQPLHSNTMKLYHSAVTVRVNI